MKNSGFFIFFYKINSNLTVFKFDLLDKIKVYIILYGLRKLSLILLTRRGGDIILMRYEPN